jgi:hypothetical protein
MMYVLYATLVLWPILLVLLGQKRWKCICPKCNGTGICADATSIHPHSCCGDCKRERVPWAFVSNNFDGGKYRDISPEGPLIGVGWVRGSFWQLLRLGRWQGSAVRANRVTRLYALRLAKTLRSVPIIKTRLHLVTTEQWTPGRCAACSETTLLRADCNLCSVCCSKVGR